MQCHQKPQTELDATAIRCFRRLHEVLGAQQVDKKKKKNSRCTNDGAPQVEREFRTYTWSALLIVALPQLVEFKQGARRERESRGNPSKKATNHGDAIIQLDAHPAEFAAGATPSTHSRSSRRGGQSRRRSATSTRVLTTRYNRARGTTGQRGLA